MSKMQTCDLCGERRYNCSNIIAYGLETTVCWKCDGEYEDPYDSPITLEDAEFLAGGRQ